jgi:hypothetical protein
MSVFSKLMCVIKFSNGAPNYRKNRYAENLRSQAVWIKDPIPVVQIPAFQMGWVYCSG